MRKILLLTFLLLALTFGVTSVAVASPYDEIQNYIIRIDMLDDATMDIEYTIEWVALRDSSSDKLNYMKIGIPNKYADEFESLTRNIASIELSTSGGSYAYLNLDREYKVADMSAGPLVVKFKIHQTHMFTYKKDTHEIWYSFTPGWFDNIEVKNLEIYWNGACVKTSDAQYTSKGYLVWNGKNLSGQEQKKFEVNVKYDADTFPNRDDSKQRTEEGISGGAILLLILLGILVVLVLIAIFSDEFDGSGGSGGRYYGGSSSTRSCACASSCACACAGGGRVGCSKKDLYSTTIHLQELKKVLNIDDITNKY